MCSEQSRDVDVLRALLHDAEREVATSEACAALCARAKWVIETATMLLTGIPFADARAASIPAGCERYAGVITSGKARMPWRTVDHAVALLSAMQNDGNAAAARTIFCCTVVRALAGSFTTGAVDDAIENTLHALEAVPVAAVDAGAAVVSRTGPETAAGAEVVAQAVQRTTQTVQRITIAIRMFRRLRLWNRQDESTPITVRTGCVFRSSVRCLTCLRRN